MSKRLTPEEEAKQLVNVTTEPGASFHSLNVLKEQFGVLQTRSQFILTLATITLTITGFSGQKIAATNQVARIFMGLGLVFILACLVILLIGSLNVRWITQFSEKEPTATIRSIIEYRNQKTRLYFFQLLLLVIGLASYVCSVLIYLWYYQS